MEPRPYFINDVPSAVRTGLTGLVTYNNHLLLHKSSNIVVRKDFRSSVLNQGKVALVSGGGSGHEPSHAGFIGHGLLTASISGNIFASPTASDVFKAIQLVGSKDSSSGGTLLIVPNYTGDRLHFGSAKEKARLEGYKVDIFVFGDDCVFGANNSGRVGRRGLAGVFFIHKIAGALAERGATLEMIKSSVESTASRIASISISLGPCNVPGIGPSFKMPPGMLEVGLGIHGERGSKRIPYIPARDAITMLIDHLTGNQSGLDGHFTTSKRLAVLFNDNGGLTTIEMNNIIKEAFSALKKQGFTVERTYVGRYVTSFDMIGICISIMVLDDNLLCLLDDPCSTIIISQGQTLSTVPNQDDIYIESELDTMVNQNVNYDSNERLISIESLFIDCVSAACSTLIANEAYLNQLDSESGDSDCGTTLASGARAILDEIRSKSLKASFSQLAAIIENVMGGTSGALYSLLFTGASKFISESRSKVTSSQLDVTFWADLLTHSIENIVQYSYAQPGDRSMIDPLFCLAQALRNWKMETKMISCAKNLIELVKRSAEATAKMEAQVGRASYTSKLANQGPDPGAWAVYLITQAILETLDRFATT